MFHQLNKCFNTILVWYEKKLEEQFINFSISLKFLKTSNLKFQEIEALHGK